MAGRTVCVQPKVVVIAAERLPGVGSGGVMTATLEGSRPRCRYDN